MLISDSKKFVFFHIQKTGGSSLSLSLQNYCNVKQYTNYEELRYNDGKVKGWQQTLHQNLIQHHPVSTFDYPTNYFSFAFVRNPYTRFASYYNAMKEYFPSLLELANRDPLPTQSSYLDKDISHIARYEDWDKEIEHIESILNIKINKELQANISKNQYDWIDYYTQEAKLAVYKLYREDFRRFYND